MMGRAKLDQNQIESFRKRICDTALRMFAEHGREGVSLRALARAVGCSHTTPYRYFDSAEAIFAAVRIRCFARFEQYLRERLEPIEDPLEALRQLGLHYFEFACHHRAEFQIMFGMDQPDPERYPESFAAGQRAWGLPLELSRAAVAGGRWQGDPETLAHLLWVGAHGVTVLQLAGKFVVGKEAREVLSLHAEIILGDKDRCNLKK